MFNVWNTEMIPRYNVQNGRGYPTVFSYYSNTQKCNFLILTGDSSYHTNGHIVEILMLDDLKQYKQKQQQNMNDQKRKWITVTDFQMPIQIKECRRVISCTNGF